MVGADAVQDVRDGAGRQPRATQTDERHRQATRTLCYIISHNVYTDISTLIVPNVLVHYYIEYLQLGKLLTPHPQMRSVVSVDTLCSFCTMLDVKRLCHVLQQCPLDG